MAIEKPSHQLENRMNQAANLTPPTKTKPAKEAKAPATGEAKEKAEKAPVDPNAPKKPRAPRQDYGFSAEATIGLVVEKAAKYRGQRADWFKRISAFEGKKVSEFMTANENALTPKGSQDPPRGWVRFFVQDGSVTLTKPVAPPPPAEAKAA
jgi:hypothetical protein